MRYALYELTNPQSYCGEHCTRKDLELVILKQVFAPNRETVLYLHY